MGTSILCRRGTWCLCTAAILRSAVIVGPVVILRVVVIWWSCIGFDTMISWMDWPNSLALVVKFALLWIRKNLEREVRKFEEVFALRPLCCR